MRLKSFAFLCLAICYQLSSIDGCLEASKPTGFIFISFLRDKDLHWEIPVPQNCFARLEVYNELPDEECSLELNIAIPRMNEKYTFCSNRNTSSTITSLSKVVIDVVKYNRYNRPWLYLVASFTLNYTIEDILCVRDEIFRCSKYSCIPLSQVCDGVPNCKGGLDEVGCEKGIMAVEGVEEMRRTAIAWLKSKKISSWGWREDTHRAIVALYLSSGVTFNGSSLEEELMIKQLELKTSLTLLRRNTDPVRAIHLSMFLNALLVTCLNPRHFYGYDLVKMLKEQVLTSPESVHPGAYLALCNAKEPLNDAVPEILLKILNSNSEYPFILDMKAFALMALSCLKSHTEIISIQYLNGSTPVDAYAAAVESLKKLQQEDGTFGNVYTTALVIQALLSNGQEKSEDWDLKGSIKYLMKQLNSSSEDFLAIHLILPILNSKSLADIAKVNCTRKSKMEGEAVTLEYINNKLGPKIYVQYILYIGDHKNVIHNLSLAAPENITVLEVMKLAEAADPKYKFKWKYMSKKMYIYEIGNITNDPEAGKYWILYWTGGHQNGTLSISTESPENLIVKDGGQLLMWYQTAEFWNEGSKSNTSIIKTLIPSSVPQITENIPV